MSHPRDLTPDQMLTCFMGFMHSCECKSSTIKSYADEIKKLQSKFGCINDADKADDIDYWLVRSSANKHGAPHRALTALRVMLTGEGKVTSQTRGRGISLEEAKSRAKKYAHMVEYLCTQHPKMNYSPSTALGYVKRYVSGPLNNDRHRDYKRSFEALYEKYPALAPVVL